MRGVTHDITDRKRLELVKDEANAKMILSQAKLSRAESVSRSGNWELYLDTNTVIASEGAIRIFGSSDEKWTLKTVMSFCLPEYRQKLDDAFSRMIIEDQPYNVQFKIKNRETDLIYDILSIAEFDKKNKIIFGVIQDVTERVRTEEKLRQRDRIINSLVDVSPLAIIILDPDENVQLWNKGAELIFGWRADEVLGKPHVIIPDFLRTQYTEISKRIFQGEVISNFETIRKRKDGTLPKVSLSSFAIFDLENKLTGRMAIIADITEKKKAEDSLRNSEERFRQVVENTGEWIWEVDEKGLFTYSSSIVENILGYSPEEITYKKHFYEFFDPEDRDELKQTFFNIFLNKESFNGFIHRNIDRQGSLVYISKSGSPIIEPNGRLRGYRGTDLDITQRVLGEEQLKKLFTAVEQSPVSIIITNTDGSIEYVNPRFTELTGYTREEALGKNPSILKSGFTQPEVYADMWNKISNGLVWSGEFCNRKNNGDLFWESAKISPIINERGVITHFVGIKEDITEKKEIHRRMIHAIIRAEEKERSRFSQELHDGLGPMLSTIKLYFQWLLEASASEKRDKIFSNGIRSIEESIQTLREISNNLSPKNLMQTGIIPAIKNFIRPINESGKLKIDLIHQIGNRFEMDIEVTVYRILTELINNSIKHANCRNISINITYKEASRIITLRYIDDGKGFNLPDVLNTSKGLGITNISQRVNSLNGKIHFDTMIGKGFSATIQLPVSNQ